MAKPITHQPAFVEVFPDVTWEPLNKEQQVKLEAICQCEGEWQQLKTSWKFPLGYFKFKHELQDTQFIKIVTSEKSKHLLASEEVTRYLRSKGINTPCLITHKQFFYQEKSYYILWYNYLSLSPLYINQKNILNTSKQLAVLHTLLKDFPSSSRQLFKSTEKLTLVSEIFTDIQNAPEIYTYIPEEVKRLICHEPTSHLSILSNHPQINHGDLNLGNIRQFKEDIHFIDFENSAQSHFSPLFDLSYLLIRTIIINDKIEDKHALVDKTVLHYFNHRDDIKPDIKESLSNQVNQAIIATNLYCLLILCLHSKSHKVANSEWQKFINFHQSIKLSYP